MASFLKKNKDFVSHSLEEKNKEEIKESPKNDWFDQEGQLVVDVYKEGEELIVRAPIAGVKTSDIDIVIENEIITIKGERKNPDKDDKRTYFLKECYFGKFSREIVLPVEVDSSRTKATIKEGILFISIPIIEREGKKKISIE